MKEGIYMATYNPKSPLAEDFIKDLRQISRKSVSVSRDLTRFLYINVLGLFRIFTEETLYSILHQASNGHRTDTARNRLANAVALFSYNLEYLNLRSSVAQNSLLHNTFEI